MKNKEICVIDIGSNSVRMVIYKIVSERFFVIEKDMKESVRLGSDLKFNNVIGQEKIKTLLNVLTLFKKICEQSNVDNIVVFGTAALRDADNGSEIINMTKNILDIDVRLLSGYEESFFSFNGAISSLDIETGGIFDLGGSSLEIVYFENKKIVNSVSLKFGALTISEIVNLENEITKEKEYKLVNFIQTELKKIPWIDKLKGLPIIGVGGSIRNIASVHLYKTAYPLEYVHNYILTKENLECIIEFVRTKTLVEKFEIKGLSKSRADIFSGTLVAINELFNFVEAKEIVISQYGIREGILYNQISKNSDFIENPFASSLKGNMSLRNLDINDGLKELKLFNKIYSVVREKYNFSLITDKMIKTSVLLSEIGKNINYLNYPLHSAFTILNMGLKGISHKEIIATALIVSKGTKKYEGLKLYLNFFTENEMIQIMRISKILNITKILYKDFMIRKEKIEIEINENDITFYLLEKTQDDLELLKLFVSKKKFINTFDKKIEFRLK